MIDSDVRFSMTAAVANGVPMDKTTFPKNEEHVAMWRTLEAQVSEIKAKGLGVDVPTV